MDTDNQEIAREIQKMDMRNISKQIELLGMYICLLFFTFMIHPISFVFLMEGCQPKKAPVTLLVALFV